MAGVRSWEETLRRLAEEDPCSDTFIALERWLEARPGYAVTFGKAAVGEDAGRIWACAITMPSGNAFQCSSEQGMGVALTNAMVKVGRVEAEMAKLRVANSEQQKPSSARSVSELLRSIVEPGSRGKPAT